MEKNAMEVVKCTICGREISITEKDDKKSVGPGEKAIKVDQHKWICHQCKK